MSHTDPTPMRLVLFDFDGTLTHRDSLLAFIRHALGTPRFLWGLVCLSPTLLAYALRLLRNDIAKEKLLQHFFGGQPLIDLQRQGAAFAQEALPKLLRAELMDKLQAHLAQGDTCVLVSASLDVYLKPWAQQQGFAEVLCSSLITDEQLLVTGQLKGSNCFGPEKPRRIKAWLQNRTTSHVTAYGDSRGDREMLALADEAHWV